MRTVYFILFVGIFIALYGLINFYIFIRGWQAIPQGFTLRSTYAVVFWTTAFSFIAGRLIERIQISVLSESLVWIGSFWIAAMMIEFSISLHCRAV